MDAQKQVLYLERVGLGCCEQPDAQYLAALQLAHLRSVPFENLSIHWDEPMDLSGEYLFEKIVISKRGGFCYECNSLFALLLDSLGYRTSLLSARVVLADGSLSPEFDHMTIMVELEDAWLVDVGFGDTFIRPLVLQPDLVQHELGRAYRLEQLGENYLMQQRLPGEDWKTRYQFTLQPRQVADFQEMFLFHQNSVQSHFKRTALASLLTVGGRITLSGNRLIYTDFLGGRSEKDIAPEDYLAVLYQEFGISRQ